MSETTPENQPQQPAGEEIAPVLRVASQYVKDLSFENPNAPLAPNGQPNKPEIQLEVNLGAKPMGDDFPLGKDFFEVELSISATAKDQNSAGQEIVQFVVETNYAGLFLIQNIPEEHMGGVLLVECPTLLFPFARQVLADAVRNGGFKEPLMLEPLDFHGMYRQQAERAQSQAMDDSSAPPVGNA